MNVPIWLAALLPLTECQLEPLMRDDGELIVWHVNLSFEHWCPSPKVPPLTKKERYGKTAIIGGDGHWSVVEIELTRRLRKFGWNAGWLDTYGGAPKEWAAWLVEPESLPPTLRDFIRDIDRSTERRGGKPDIVAWQGDSADKAIFLECKGPGDDDRSKAARNGLTLRSTQACHATSTLWPSGQRGNSFHSLPPTKRMKLSFRRLRRAISGMILIGVEVL